MKTVVNSLLDSQSTGRCCVLAQLVETRGSTPQKAGATMLVFDDGTQVGTLGGGCVEAEVKQKALASLADGESRLEQFQLNHDYGWDDGLICGGRMTTLIVPLCDEGSFGYYRTYQQLLADERGLTEAIIVEHDTGSPGGRALFDADGQCRFAHPETVPIGAMSAGLQSLSSRPKPYVVNGVSYLPHLPTARLMIVGAGHVGAKLAGYAADVDFHVTVIDDREQYCNASNIPCAQDLIVGELDELLPQLAIDRETFCVIVTRGHNHDEEALFHLIQKSPRYLGMIGSRRKIRLIFDDLVRQGIAPELLDGVRAPIGLDIGSQTVSEIAISIVAELIQVRNRPVD